MIDDITTSVKRLRNPWLRRLWQTQWIGVLSLLVSLATLILTYFWKPDDLVVYFRFVEPQEIGTNQVHLNYIFSNAGKTSVFIEDVSLVELFYHSNSSAWTIPNLDACKNDGIETPSLIAARPSVIQSLPTFHPKEQWYSMLYTPKSIFLGGVQSQFSSVNIDAGEQRAISTVYEMSPVDWSKFNVVLLCPIIRLFNSSGQPSTVICDGIQSDQFPPETGTRYTPAALARLLPTSRTNCHISLFYF